ncbi:hypothetical protein ANANG_G00208220 [Anguilla anguilla]|uniref:Holliday junction regulator protein family C-terminal domain-containing protein n=1 Tax=Anguilla anguilla TaxID=7936 RepID=A0A9D3LZA2_ANGAN|nr:hypothetical protein ANANG_G00208220 [Anguilla anguilla]
MWYNTFHAFIVPRCLMCPVAGFHGDPFPPGDAGSPRAEDGFCKLSEEGDFMYKRCAALNKKEHRGCDSPDPDSSYVLTPHTEEKYKKINEEFDNMMRNHKIPAGLPPQSFSMHVPCPSPAPAASPPTAPPAPWAASPWRALRRWATAGCSRPQGSLHRSVGSPGSPAAPSAGSTGNGFVNPRESPGLLGTPSGNGLGKGMATKSPPPPGVNMGMGGRKPDLRVVIPPSSKGMMPPLLSEEDMELNVQRISSSQAAQSLATPVVSVTTPSLAPQGLVYSAMPTAYNTDYCLSSAELSSLQGFCSSGGLSVGSASAWQQHQLGQISLGSMAGGCHIPQGSNISINTNQNVSIKSEPISPPRERMTPSGFPAPPVPRPPGPAGGGPLPGRQPELVLQLVRRQRPGGPPSRLPLPAGPGPARRGGAEDRQSPSVKRMRMDAWVT